MEKRIINLKNKEVAYELRDSKRARRARLAVYCDSSFVVTKPRGMSDAVIEKFIIEKADWIVSKIEYFKQFKVSEFFKNNKGDYLKRKVDALKFANEKVAYYNKFYNFKFNNISVKNQRTRWGSCSSKGNLNFNYKILLLPENIADYVIVHELCHLKELNHSYKFWNLVAQTIPNYSNIRKELMKKGLIYG